MEKYIFIKHNNEWWYKITDINKFADFKLNKEKIWQEAFNEIRLEKKEIKNRFSKLAYEISERQKERPIDVLCNLEEGVLNAQKHILLKFKCIYINEHGEGLTIIDEGEKVESDIFCFPKN